MVLAPTFFEFSAIVSWKRFPVAVEWTAVLIVLALLLWAVSRSTPWAAPVRWFALALAGQACSLQLLDVGPLIHLQLFYEWRIVLGTYRIIFLVLLFFQAALVAWGARRLLPNLKSYLGGLLNWKTALALGVLLAYSSITIPTNVAVAFVHGGFGEQAARYFTKVCLAMFTYSVAALNLALVATTLPAEFCERVSFRLRNRSRRLPWLCALWVVVVSSLVAWLVFERIPHVPDEFGYLFQAKYLAAGHLYLPPPPEVDSFYCPFQMLDNGKWYNTVPLGWPAALALGVRLGMPWLVNPLLGGIAILLAHALLRPLYSREAADGAVMLLAASPWMLFMSASLMAHPLTLVLALTALIAVQRTRESGSIIWASAAGLSVGALLHVRPLDAIIVGIVGGGWWLSAGWKKLRLASLAATLATGLAMTGLLLAYNRTMTGDAFYVPLNKYIDQTVYKGANRLGFGKDVGNFGWTGLDALPGHGPLDVVMNTNQNLYMLNFDLFGWAFGSLVFVFLLLVWREFRGNGVAWGVFFTTVALMSCYWYSGVPDFGARYWYLTLVPLSALTVEGARALARRLRQTPVMPGSEQRLWAFMAVASILGIINQLPWRSLDKYHNYRTITPAIRELKREYGFTHGLVFIRGSLRPDYSSAIPFNPPTFDRDAPGPLFVLDHGPESRERLRAYYADRPAWVVAGPSGTGRGFEIIEGPLPPLTQPVRAH